MSLFLLKALIAPYSCPLSGLPVFMLCKSCSEDENIDFNWNGPAGLKAVLSLDDLCPKSPSMGNALWAFFIVYVESYFYYGGIRIIDYSTNV